MENNTLKRGLKNRHVQLIALGGAIGTGFFLGSASAIQMAGPSVILCYAIGGFIAFLIMRQLGEMMAQEPVAGSFSNLAYKYWGDFPGLLSGWNYWMLYVLVGMSELTAVSIYINFWFPDIPQWQVTTFFFLLINAINFLNVRIYGEMEFWFASIKISAMIAIIIFGIYLLSSGTGGANSSVSNLWKYGGFFIDNGHGFTMALALVLFSFGGLELVGIAAAETDAPQKTIPKAVNQVIYRIIIFYIGSLTILLCLYPWNKLANPVPKERWAEYMAASPFVQIFSEIGLPSAAHLLNFIILTAALSVYNSCVYCNSRMLYGLALQKNAPQSLAKTNDRGVPVAAICISSLATLAGIFLNYIMPQKALGIMISLVIASLLINWAMITLTHIKFRRAKERINEPLIFKAFLFPYSDYFCLLFNVFILWELYRMGEIAAVTIMPLWIIFVALGYLIKRKMSEKSHE